MTGFEEFFDVHTHQTTGGKLAIAQADLLNLQRISGYFSFGTHPENANSDFGITQDFLQIVQNQMCLAIGEIGLDTRYDNNHDQERIFIAQLQLAETLGKPVILHCVNSWDRCRFLHGKHAPNTPLIFHGFNKPAISNNVISYHPAFVSIGSSVLTNSKLQEIIPQIPIDRLFVETDTSNTSLIDIYQKLADLKSLSLRDFSIQIRQNIQRIFQL